MSIKSVYSPDLSSLEIDGLVRITGDAYRHLMVARVEREESIELFDGKGAVWILKVVLVSKKEVVAQIAERRKAAREPYDLVLGQALMRMTAFEFALEKSVEIGVTRIVPFLAGRSNINIPRRPERWLKIIVEAAKQSKRYHLPAIDEITTLDGILSIPAQTKIMFAERGGGSLKPGVSGTPALYLVGPEGGWTDLELERAAHAGFSLVTLGANILKAETAAIVGGALIKYELEAQAHQ